MSDGHIAQVGEPTEPAPPAQRQRRSHAQLCVAVANELEDHYGTLDGLLQRLEEAAHAAADNGRNSTLADLARTAVTVQAAAARAMAGLLSVSTEGRLAAAALGRGGPRGPLIEVGSADAD